MPMWLIET